MGNYQGKATGKYDFGETKGKNGKQPTPYVAVDVQLFNEKGEAAHVLTKKFFFVESSEQNMRISIEGLQLLGARMLNGDPTDLYGLGSTMVGIVTELTQYGEEIKYINPPGPRGVKDEERMDQNSLAAFRARMMPRVAGIVTSKGGAPVAAPQPTARAPWQGGAQRPQQAPVGPAPWDQRAPQQPAAQPPANPAADVDPWDAPDAYAGLPGADGAAETPRTSGEESVAAQVAPTAQPSADPRQFF